jgi:hypothetical protein
MAKKMRFEVFTVIQIWFVVFWVMMPHGLIGGYQCFGVTYSLHLQVTLKLKVTHFSEMLVTYFRLCRHQIASMK